MKTLRQFISEAISLLEDVRGRRLEIGFLHNKGKHIIAKDPEMKGGHDALASKHNMDDEGGAIASGYTRFYVHKSAAGEKELGYEYSHHPDAHKQVAKHLKNHPDASRITFDIHGRSQDSGTIVGPTAHREAMQHVNRLSHLPKPPRSDFPKIYKPY